MGNQASAVQRDEEADADLARVEHIQGIQDLYQPSYTQNIPGYYASSHNTPYAPLQQSAPYPPPLAAYDYDPAVTVVPGRRQSPVRAGSTPYYISPPYVPPTSGSRYPPPGVLQVPPSPPHSPRTVRAMPIPIVAGPEPTRYYTAHQSPDRYHPSRRRRGTYSASPHRG
jgi:hypothetical protein